MIYAQNWALVVGINNYIKAGPLLHARKDARAEADILTTSLVFRRHM
jgi:hypothetical protein